MSVVYVLAVPESDRHAMLASSMIDFHCMHAIKACVFDEITKSCNWGLDVELLVFTGF